MTPASRSRSGRSPSSPLPRITEVAFSSLNRSGALGRAMMSHVGEGDAGRHREQGIGKANSPLPLQGRGLGEGDMAHRRSQLRPGSEPANPRSEEHTSELQSLMRISYAVFCLKQKIQHNERTRAS